MLTWVGLKTIGISWQEGSLKKNIGQLGLKELIHTLDLITVIDLHRDLYNQEQFDRVWLLQKLYYPFFYSHDVNSNLFTGFKLVKTLLVIIASLINLRSWEKPLSNLSSVALFYRTK